MDLNVLIQNATDEELLLFAEVAQRANSKPAIIVTTLLEGRRRYVVAQEDEPMFADLVGLSAEQLRAAIGNDLGSFGARWLRAYGKVDEMHRSLSLHEVASVTAADRGLVWYGRRTDAEKEATG